MSEKFRLNPKIDFQNTLFTKCINIIIDSIGPSITLRSIDRTYIVINMDPFRNSLIKFQSVSSAFKYSQQMCLRDKKY